MYNANKDVSVCENLELMMPFNNQTDSAMLSEQKPAGVIDVQVRSMIPLRLVPFFIMVGLCLVGFALARGTGIPMSVRTHPLVYGCVLFLAIYACTELGLRLGRPRVLARTRNIVTRFKERPVRDLVGGLFGNHGRVLQRMYLKTMVRVLAEQGRVGVTIRSGPPELATAIDPIAVTFEPRLLDEADASTVELQDALDSTTRGATTAVTQDSLAGRRVVRNIRRTGGWVMFAIFAINFIVAAVESIETWRVTRFLVIWGLILIAMIFGLFRPRLSGWRGQWLAVPGGIIIRTAGFWGRKWGLHLFDRRRSALVVHRLTRNLLYICVADAESHQSGRASPREVEFLLRAWLSPVPPPPVEKLTDWL